MGLFRILLAISVVASHGSAVLGSTMYPGGVAVQIFFMISGFYMTLVLGSRYQLTSAGLKLFYSNRFLRLYPAFLAVTLIGWLMFFAVWAVIHKMPANEWTADYGTMSWPTKISLIATNWLMIGTDVFSNCYYSAAEGLRFVFPHDPPEKLDNGGVWMHVYRNIGPAWSIGTEIWFYLIVPFLVRLRWWWLAALFLLSLAVRLYISEHLGRYPYFFFPAQLVFFIVGIWSCQAYRTFRLGERAPAWAKYLLYANWALVWLYPWYGANMPRALLYGFVAASLPLMFAVTKNSKWDRFIGDLSYPAYLVHLMLHGLIFSRAGVNNGTLDAAASLIAALGLVLIVERPFEKLRKARVERSTAVA